MPKKTNPSIIPRNHIVENVINAAVDKNNYKPLDELVFLLEKPFNDYVHKENYISAPKENEDIKNTFCGT